MSERIELSPPVAGRVDWLIIAGEHSGDQHAARLVEDIRHAHPDWRVAALGGPALKAAGAQVLFDMTAVSVVGLIEVLKHYPLFKELFNQLIAWIERHRPRGVLLVDYPGFNLRLAKALAVRGLIRKGGGHVAVCQYISPQIWAWKAKRRFAMARYLDELAVIFPFEVDCYADTSLPVHFVGHPFVRPGYVNPTAYDPAGPVLLLPGSRAQAVGRIFPLLLATVHHAHAAGDRVPFVCLYPSDEILRLLQQLLRGSGLPADAVHFIPVGHGVAVSAVLTSSGTMSLNCALAAIPGTVVYRAHPVTAWLGARLIRVPWLGIANLILQRELYPELIQNDATAPRLYAELQRCRCDVSRQQHFAAGARDLVASLTGSHSVTLLSRLEAVLL